MTQHPNLVPLEQTTIPLKRAAALMGVSWWTVRRMIDKGELQARRVRRRFYTSRAAIEAATPPVRPAPPVQSREAARRRMQEALK